MNCDLSLRTHASRICLIVANILPKISEMYYRPHNVIIIITRSLILIDSYNSRKVSCLYRTGIQGKIHHITNENNACVKKIIIMTTKTRFLFISVPAQEPKGQLQRRNTNARENASSNYH